MIVITETSWADVPNWPRMPDMETMKEKNMKNKKNNKKDKNDVDEEELNEFPEPDSPNISWFFEKDVDTSGTLTLSEIWEKYSDNDWYNERYDLVLDKFIYEADLNKDRGIDINEYIK